MKMFKSADEFYNEVEQWNEEVNILREILLKSPLEETVKWGLPAYLLGKKNILGVGTFKSYFGLWFHQGALLADNAKVLINAQEGKTQALRQWRMKDKSEIDEKLILEYVYEAIENQKAGREIKPVRNKEVVIHAILQNAMNKNPELKSQFESFTIGKQREYADYINNAKQEKTKLSRLEKIIPMILSGKGLNDRYR